MTTAKLSRDITYPVSYSASGQKISSFLAARGYSRKNLAALKKDPACIRVNGRPAHMNDTLTHGDMLEVWIPLLEPSAHIRAVELPFRVIYEDEDLLVADKPAGMPIHPSRNNPDNSLGNALTWYFSRQGRPFVFRCINRLDRDTSGLTIVAKHMVSGAILGQMVSGHRIHREYLAIVRGQVTPPQGTVDAPIARKEGICLERAVDFSHGDRAVTHYRVIMEKNGYSLLSLLLETGRTHQIRVHMAYLGYPLIGDFLYHPAYGGNQLDRLEAATENAGGYEIRRQALHAHRLIFRHPMTGERLEFSSPLPDDMAQLMR